MAAAPSPPIAPPSEDPQFKGDAAPSDEPRAAPGAPEPLTADTTAAQLLGEADPATIQNPSSAVGKGEAATGEIAIDLADLAALESPLGAELPGLELGVPMLLESPAATLNPYLLRSPERRKEMLEKLGGSAETEAAISAALGWFTRNQEKGRALVHEKAQGRLQGIAAIALAEAYGLTRDERLRPILEKAAQFIADAQTNQGSWRYSPKDKKGGDTSVYGWQVMALKSCEMAGVKTRGAEECPGMAREGRRRKTRRPLRVHERQPEARHGRRRDVLPPAHGHPAHHHPMMEESARYLKTTLPDPKKAQLLPLLLRHPRPLPAPGPGLGGVEIPGSKRSSSRPSGRAGKIRGAGTRAGTTPARPAAPSSPPWPPLSLEVYYRYLPMYSGMPER